MGKKNAKKTLKLAEEEANKTYENLYDMLSGEVPDENDSLSIKSFLSNLENKRNLFISSSRAYESALDQAGHSNQYEAQFSRRREILRDCFDRSSLLNKQLIHLGSYWVSNLDHKDLSSLRSVDVVQSSSEKVARLGSSLSHLSGVSKDSANSEEEEEEEEESEKGTESKLEDLASKMNCVSVEPCRSILEPKVDPGHHRRVSKRRTKLDAVTAFFRQADLLKTPSNPFEGDIGVYPCWEANLKNKMRGLDLSPTEELSILVANTAGSPQRSILQTMILVTVDNAESVLQLVWNTLHERYGSDDLQADHIAEQLYDFPSIPFRDCKALQKFLDITNRALSLIERSNLLDEFCSIRGLRLLARKLPEDLQYRWQRRVADRVDFSGQPPTFSLFNQFLKYEERVLNNPYFTPQLLDSTLKTSRVHMSTDKNISDESSRGDKFIVGSTNPKPGHKERKFNHRGNPHRQQKSNKCKYHKTDSHETSECRSFEELPHDKKKKLISEAKVCFRCLGPHYIKSCDKQVKCSHCQGTHLTVMHRPSFKQETSDEGRSASTGHCYQMFSKTLLVDITSKYSEKKIRCYAIINEQSVRCFADPSLIEQLGIEATPCRYTVRTMSGLSSEMEGHTIEGLMIKGVGENRWYQLPSTLTNVNIPDTSTEMATPDVVKTLDHVAHLAKYFNEHDASARPLVLIGRDAGTLLGSKSHGGGNPIACKTALGWALLGSVNRGVGPVDEAASVMDHENHHFSTPILVPTCWEVSFRRV